MLIYPKFSLKNLPNELGAKRNKNANTCERLIHQLTFYNLLPVWKPIKFMLAILFTLPVAKISCFGQKTIQVVVTDSRPNQNDLVLKSSMQLVSENILSKCENVKVVTRDNIEYINNEIAFQDIYTEGKESSLTSKVGADYIMLVNLIDIKSDVTSQSAVMVLETGLRFIDIKLGTIVAAQSKIYYAKEPTESSARQNLNQQIARTVEAMCCESNRNNVSTEEIEEVNQPQNMSLFIKEFRDKVFADRARFDGYDAKYSYHYEATGCRPEWNAVEEVKVRYNKPEYEKLVTSTDREKGCNDYSYATGNYNVYTKLKDGVASEKWCGYSSGPDREYVNPEQIIANIKAVYFYKLYYHPDTLIFEEKVTLNGIEYLKYFVGAKKSLRPSRSYNSKTGKSSYENHEYYFLNATTKRLEFIQVLYSDNDNNGNEIINSFVNELKDWKVYNGVQQPEVVKSYRNGELQWTRRLLSFVPK